MNQAGHTLLELTLVLGLMGLLTMLGASRVDLGAPGLAFLAGELRGILDQAFLQAQARGREVSVCLCGPGGDVPSLRLPRGVRWGLPPTGVPLPPDLDLPRKAHLTGAAHARITVTPRGTATAGAWYLTDGKDALYLGLNGQGGLTVLRYRHRRRTWTGA